MLVDGVAYLDPATAVFQAMVEGWETQQRARGLRAHTISGRSVLVRRFGSFTNAYPWQWRPADAEDFIAGLRSGPRPIAVSTARQYEMTLQMFCQYVTDPHYGWGPVCLERFGSAPAQILHEWNTVRHVTEFEGQPHRRPLTYDEVQALFDAADGLAEEVRARRRKGVLTAMRDAALLKTVYAYGLRRREAVGLDLTDLRHNPKAAQYGQLGALFVRWGKASRGGAPKRRTVLTVPEMDWVVPVARHWIDEVRPRFGVGAHPALWVTERGGRLSRRAANEAFTTARDAAGLDGRLDLHCLRHSDV